MATATSGRCRAWMRRSPRCGRVPGAQVEVPDAGCCGMAGAFGYEAEHYDVSMTVGERALFPAVRNSPGATVVTTGVSCRQQVEHGTGVTPLHLAEFLAAQLTEE